MESQTSIFERLPNISETFSSDVSVSTGLSIVIDGTGDLEATAGPEDIFAYVYAVLHSPEYRSRYAEFLKIDFPRLPLTSDIELFRSLVSLGDELVKTQLLELDLPQICIYPADGNNVVEAIRFDGERSLGDTASGSDTTGRVWINTTQYFDDVPTNVWDFHIGGYQVCHKWLKDRKGRTLNYDDLTHYKKIVSALSETIRLMAEIDTAIRNHGGFPFK